MTPPPPLGMRRRFELDPTLPRCTDLDTLQTRLFNM